jgi:hypothetical protein
MRRIVVIAVLLSLAVMAALPASAGIGNNPNADHITNLACEDGTTAPLIIAVGRAGHDPAGPAAGVALSLWVLSGENGTPVFEVYDVPGKGLDNLTTWCWWFNPAEDVWVGGDILFHPSLR